MLFQNWAEEIFFYMYQLHQPYSEILKMPLILKRWLIERWVNQKEKEHEASEAAARKARSKK